MASIGLLGVFGLLFRSNLQPSRLFDCDRVKCRFSSPLEMVVDMVQHARQEGRLWAEP